MVALYVIAGAVLGFLIGLTGVGGGVVAVPVLLLLGGLEPITAVGTAGLYSVLTKVYAAYRHANQKTINWGVSLRFLIAALPGLMVSAFAVKYLKATLPPHGVEALQSAISYTVIGAIAFSLAVILIDFSRLRSRFFGTAAGRALGTLGVMLIGAVMGATSVGGGILIIPALILFYGETHKYVGSSIVIAVLLMAVMSGIYAFTGSAEHGTDVDTGIALLMAAGSLLGTHHGSTLSKRLPPRRLRFAVVGVIVLAIFMLLLDRFY
ncbi:MAG: sulfite exporter TauE/SafE family protein [Pseudomonadota bacterium]|nr:sulfite exporter TauE/SafE family protein [Pseudomonadota bacterium]